MAKFRVHASVVRETPTTFEIEASSLEEAYALAWDDREDLCNDEYLDVQLVEEIREEPADAKV